MNEYKWGMNDYTVSTLCEICKNACGGCSWSRYGEAKPVEGWEAIRNDLICHDGHLTSHRVGSYIVLSYPQYRPDKFASKYPFDKETAKRRAMIRITLAGRMRKAVEL